MTSCSSCSDSSQLALKRLIAVKKSEISKFCMELALSVLLFLDFFFFQF